MVVSTTPPRPRNNGDTLLRTTIIPLFLMLVSPIAVQFVWVVCYHHQGNLSSALTTSPQQLWAQFPKPTLPAVLIPAIFLIAQLTLLVVIPGTEFRAIPTPMGNRPRYVLNGVPSFLLTVVVILSAPRFGFRPASLYDHFGPMLAVLNRFALVATLLLYLRGLYAPTNSDSGATGHGLIWDMWHGTELHPEIYGVSLKQLINCRFAMMGWAVAILVFAMKQVELYGSLSNSMAVSTTLQMVYIFKFFLWEGGYFNSVCLSVYHLYSYTLCVSRLMCPSIPQLTHLLFLFVVLFRFMFGNVLWCKGRHHP